MTILVYNTIQLVTYPFLIFYFLIRILIKKENYNSLSQKLFCSQKEIKEYDYIIHVSSIGELNSINFLYEHLLFNKKILITCSTLTSYNSAKSKYPNQDIYFLPIDMFIITNIFLKKNKTKVFIWIDSEIWPYYIFALNKKNIKTYLINARISKKSFNRWKFFKNFISIIGSKYEKVFASSKQDQDRFSELFKRDIFYYGNLKFYQKTNITKKNKNIICFGSIHHQEFKDIIDIILNINLKKIDEVIIIPRHPINARILKGEMIKSNLKNSKIKIIEEIGQNIESYKKSKVTIMGGSFFNHGGQNPLEPVSCGSYVISGGYIHNFNSIYQELIKENLCHISKGGDNDLLASYIGGLMSIFPGVMQQLL